ncbi:MAG: tRNA lysidine(34) synthetase TilS [Clostridiaceae bacterium]|nr:tRNA lysidine(34) synthetase TilS [Clostridiaceae bacterium]
MLDRVRRTIAEYKLIEKGDNILVGVSGGADSICLLHILDYLSDEMGIKIYVVHINHLLRGDESNADEEYVKQLCDALGVKLFSISVNVKELAEKTNSSIEEAAREARYKEFQHLAQEIGNCKIAVAHNKNDQAETVIMNIIRGTGFDGIKGIDYVRGNIIRPLLNIDRKEIEEYCRQHNLKPRTDSTNLLNIYTRNKIRLDVIPFINANFNTNIVENITRMTELVRDDLSYLKSVSEKAYKKCLLKPDLIKSDPYAYSAYSSYGEDNESYNSILLDINKLKGLHKAILKRVLRIAVENVKGNIKDVESVHINKLISLCSDGRTGAEIHLPANIRAARSYDALKIYLHNKYDEYNKAVKNNKYNETDKNKINECKSNQSNKTALYKVNIPGVTQIDALNIELKGTILNKESFDIEMFRKLGYNSLIQFFDYEKIIEGQEVILRNRQKGDLIKPLKSKGTKKLKEYMIDNKISRDIRDNIMLLAKGSEIIWIVGYRISDKFKVTENTKSILKLEVKV